jgi:uncharacterized coiled-coil protein SlyX
MKIFKQEIRDGIADLVQARASIAYCMPAVLCENSRLNSSLAIEKIKAESANPKQIDLYYIKSILVSTGWNKNDDVFSSEETWAARNTPEDKQFNFMHNENDIIGHITGSYVVDKNGNPISDDVKPNEFDIITEAVIYNSWTNPENRDRMEKIISEIEEGKWFVSMECLFSGFDYALIDNSGNSKLLERNEGSAFLTKHLRAYGGTGEYEGYKIGRSLREISFSGKGLVSKPANPRSIILDASRAFSTEKNVSDITNFQIGDDIMSDSNLLEKQLADMRSELASTKEENKTLRAQIEELTSKEQSDSISKLEATVAEKDQAITTLNTSISTLEATVSELQATLAMKDEEMKKKDQEMYMMKKKEKMAMRKASLLDAGFDDSEVEESLATYDSLDDDTFDAVIAAMKKKMAKWSEDKEKMMKKEEKPKAEQTSEEETVAEEKVAELLEGVSTTEATLVDASDDVDELLATRASVAEWLENNVLRK